MQPFLWHHIICHLEIAQPYNATLCHAVKWSTFKKYLSTSPRIFQHFSTVQVQFQIFVKGTAVQVHIFSHVVENKSKYFQCNVRLEALFGKWDDFLQLLAYYFTTPCLSFTCCIHLKSFPSHWGAHKLWATFAWEMPILDQICNTYTIIEKAVM